MNLKKEITCALHERRYQKVDTGSRKSEFSKHRNGIGRKLVCVVASVALFTCSVPAMALAADSQGGGGTPPDAQGGAGGGGGANTTTYDYSGSYSGTFTADGEENTADSQNISASDSNTNAVLAENGGTATITSSTVAKSGDSSDSDSCNFYGVNSVVLAVGDSTMVYISDTAISATSEGSNGIFATDSGTVYANDSTVSTTSDNSRGLDATYGGTIVANNMDINTKGDHSATLATDRGGGNISVANSQLVSEGDGSPIIYSTGVIEVSNVTGKATGSQIAGMEGLNTIKIYDSTLTSTNTDKTGSDPIANGIIIYQSTSGDADTSSGEAALFQAVDSTLSSSITSGSMFYLTNTTANVVLQNTTLDFDSSSAALLTAEGNDSNNWGSAGSNGADVTFTGIGETMSGDISADTISSVDVYLLDGSSWTGAATITENSSSSASTVDDNLSVNVDSTSTWVVSGDSTVYNLNVESGGKVVDSSGNTVKVVDESGNTLVDGSSSVTITVKGSYGTTVTTSSANEVQTASIDRADFDSYFGTSTVFGDSSSSDSSSSAKLSDVASAVADAIVEKINAA